MSSVAAFYDELADDYHLNYVDWQGAVRRQGRTLALLIQEQVGKDARTVLDCSCGIGTQAIGLALAGFTVTGTDISSRSIERAMREAEAFHVDVDFAVADMRSVGEVVTGKFEVVISCDNSLPHLLTDDDIMLALANMHATLRPGGLLIIGIRDYDEIVRARPRATPPQVFDRDAGRSLLFQVWDWSADSRWYDLSLFVVKSDGNGWRTDCHTTRYRALLRDELDRFLSNTGFVNAAWHVPDNTGHHQPLLTARRPDNDSPLSQPATPSLG